MGFHSWNSMDNITMFIKYCTKECIDKNILYAISFDYMDKYI